MFSPKLTDNANVNLTKLGERFIAMTETPIPVAVRSPRRSPRPALHMTPPGSSRPRTRTSTARPRGCSTTPPSSGRGTATASSCFAPDELEARGASRPTPVREPAYMHSFGLTERWLVLAEFPFVVNPLRARVQRPPLHRELPLEARARHALPLCSTGESGRRVGPFETDALLRLPPRQRLRGRRRRRGRDICTFRDAAIVEDLYMERLRAGKPVASPAWSASGSRRPRERSTPSG